MSDKFEFKRRDFLKAGVLAGAATIVLTQEQKASATNPVPIPERAEWFEIDDSDELLTHRKAFVKLVQAMSIGRFKKFDDTTCEPAQKLSRMDGLSKWLEFQNMTPRVNVRFYGLYESGSQLGTPVDKNLLMGVALSYLENSGARSEYRLGPIGIKGLRWVKSQKAADRIRAKDLANAALREFYNLVKKELIDANHQSAAFEIPIDFGWEKSPQALLFWQLAHTNPLAPDPASRLRLVVDRGAKLRLLIGVYPDEH